MTTFGGYYQSVTDVAVISHVNHVMWWWWQWLAVGKSWLRLQSSILERCQIVDFNYHDSATASQPASSPPVPRAFHFSCRADKMMMVVTGTVLMVINPTLACTSQSSENVPEGGNDPEAWLLSQKALRFCKTTPGWMTCEFSPKWALFYKYKVLISHLLRLNYSTPLGHSPCYNYNLDYCYNM